MKSYLISDNIDTLVGLKVAGIKGEVIHSREEVLKKIEELKKDEELGIIILTEKIVDMIAEEVKKMKLSKSLPLIVEIPDRHGTTRGQDNILKYVRESIGLKI